MEGFLFPETAECVAVREGLLFAATHDFTIGIIESDSQVVVEAITESHGRSSWYFGIRDFRNC
ncbi:hypothetical protein Syun_014364 [Stephania yunnanensis]|uniref:RNase H type-1 domain-containing protein n=1 Tax=Stephania yunnanensis TaxID=152371 RepID=A0AAP0JJL0_9MAGN